MEAITSVVFFFNHILELKEQTVTFTQAALWVWGILCKADDAKQT